MILQRHIKRTKGTASRVRDKGRSTADGSKIVDPSPAHGLSPITGVRLIVVTALLIVPLIALLIGLAPADTCGLEPDSSIKFDARRPQSPRSGPVAAARFLHHRHQASAFL